MESRIKALDGIRGFAALSVFLSHSGFEAEKVFPLPIAHLFYRIFQVGPNSVQILFVLCGFFMALLYSDVDNIIKFLRKRYTRIFPVFIVVCLYLTLVQALKINYLLQIPLLIFTALAYSTSWKLYRRNLFLSSKGDFILIIFLFLQLLLAAFSSIFSSHIFLKGFLDNLYLFLSNITLTTSFAQYYTNLSSVFWSLLPEVSFYLLFPIIAIPLIKLCKKNSILLNSLIIFALIKILFDMDKAALTSQSLKDFYWGRWVGFAVGIIIGTIYKNRGNLWIKLSKLFSSNYISLIALALLLLAQWADNIFSNSSNYNTINLYYLASSCTIGIAIIAAITPNTIMSSLFSNKFLTYIGMVSYSFYLTHLNCVEIVGKILNPLWYHIKSPALIELISLIITSLISIAVATILYWSVEYLYFVAKNKAISKTNVQNKIMKATNRPRFIKMFLPTLIIGIIFIVYTGSFTPTLQMANHINNPFNIENFNPKALINNTIQLPFKAINTNLATINMQMYYEGDAYQTAHSNKPPATLIFRLLDEKHNLIFQSQRSAFNIEGQPNFPFGFPIINDSKGKIYNVELELKDGSENDQVFLDTNPVSMVSGYTISKNELLHKPYIYFINRLVFVITNPNALFAIAFVLICMFLIIRKNSLLSNKGIKKYV